MATILVDYENVSTTEGLKGAEYLNENDTLIFYIAAECGCLAKSGAKQICIVSKDKGFSAVVDFFRVKNEKPDMTVYVAGNIEKAILTSNAPEDVERKKLIQEKSKALNLDS